MPGIRLARRPAVRPNGLTARAGLVLLAALASVLVSWNPGPIAVDEQTGFACVANEDDDSVSIVDVERSGKVFASAMNVYGKPAVSDSTTLLRIWLRRWLPWSWVSRLLPPAPAATTGTVTMRDLAWLSA
jgi:hypothetical protein